MERTAEEIKVTRGSDNIFEDLGFENPRGELAKAELLLEIARIMSKRKLSQAALAKTIGMDQPAVSRLLRGRTAGFTIDRLTKILNRLGQDVEIRVRPVQVKTAEGRVFVVANGSESGGYTALGLPSNRVVKESKARYPAKPPKKK